MKLDTSAILVLGLAAAACTRRAPLQVEPPRAATPPSTSPDRQTPSDQPGTVRQPDGGRQPESQNPGGGVDPGPTDTTASLPIELDERAMSLYVDSTAALRYRFAYGTKKDEGDITFVGGKAKIVVNKLPIGETHDLTLDVLEAGIVKLKGDVKALKLTANMSPVPLTLSAVTGDTADLTIDLSIGNSGGSGGSGGGGSGGGGSGGGGSGGGGSGGGGSGGGGNGPSFARDVKSILENQCTECHHQGAKEPDLSSYDGAKAFVERIIVRSSAGTMPPAPRDKVAASDLATLRAWQSGGLNP